MSEQNGNGQEQPTPEDQEQQQAPQALDPLAVAGSICMDVMNEMRVMRGSATRRDRLALAEALAALSTAASTRDLAAGLAFIIQSQQQAQAQPVSGLVVPR